MGRNHFKASEDNPKVRVKSSKTGKEVGWVGRLQSGGAVHALAVTLASSNSRRIDCLKQWHYIALLVESQHHVDRLSQMQRLQCCILCFISWYEMCIRQPCVIETINAQCD